MASSNITKCAHEIHSKYKIGDCSIAVISSILSSYFTQDKVIVDNTTCQSLIKSGDRKNTPCGLTSISGTTSCKRHTIKPEVTKGDESVTEVTPKKVSAKKKVCVESTSTDSESVIEIQPKKPISKRKILVESKPKAIINLVESKKKMFNIMKNKYNNYEHKDTGFIFDSNTDEVIGKQLADGTISQLGLNDIELCKENGWVFIHPLTVNTTSQKTHNPLIIVDDEDESEEDSDD